MRDYGSLERQFMDVLGASRAPVAVAFRDAPPEGVSPFAGMVPSGCTFWRLAAGGRSFYTVQKDHYNCPIGSYTHNVALPPERAGELMRTLTLMSDVGYIRMEEIPGVFKLAAPPSVVVYAPLRDTPVDPDVVLFAGRPGRIMVLMEAAGRAGIAANLPMLTRPTCMAIPAAMNQGSVASAGCIGNRVYTGLGEDEFYMAVPGSRLEALALNLQTVSGANATLAQYHEARLPLLELK
ncbi:MAG TPA: DUF169 domain-containing protein [Bryobacteraceae bacterium]|nr:DUF169 domain-containing protein [Bryobacteraceae bacterium]